jgi:hypothetical protein
MATTSESSVVTRAKRMLVLLGSGRGVGGSKVPRPLCNEGNLEDSKRQRQHGRFELGGLGSDDNLESSQNGDGVAVRDNIDATGAGNAATDVTAAADGGTAGGGGDGGGDAGMHISVAHMASSTSVVHTPASTPVALADSELNTLSSELNAASPEHPRQSVKTDVTNTVYMNSQMAQSGRHTLLSDLAELSPAIDTLSGPLVLPASLWAHTIVALLAHLNITATAIVMGDGRAKVDGTMKNTKRRLAGPMLRVTQPVDQRSLDSGQVLYFTLPPFSRSVSMNSGQ